MWVIYAIMVDDKIDYIGMTRNLQERTHGHQGNRYWDWSLTPVVLCRARTLETAKRAERRLIRKHKPPRNIQHNPKKGAFTYVETHRLSPSGVKIPVRFRLREGMMHPDEARKIWCSPEDLINAVALRSMPGWTLERALSMFGPRYLYVKRSTR